MQSKSAFRNSGKYCSRSEDSTKENRGEEEEDQGYEKVKPLEPKKSKEHFSSELAKNPNFCQLETKIRMFLVSFNH